MTGRAQPARTIVRVERVGPGLHIAHTLRYEQVGDDQLPVREWFRVRRLTPARTYGVNAPWTIETGAGFPAFPSSNHPADFERKQDALDALERGSR